MWRTDSHAVPVAQVRNNKGLTRSVAERRQRRWSGESDTKEGDKNCKPGHRPRSLSCGGLHIEL